MKRALLTLGLVLAIAAALAWLYVQTAGLAAIVHGGAGPPTLVLLHGYGSHAEDWLQFVGKIQFPPQGRLVFPQAPLRGPIAGGRGWWWLNLEGHIPPGEQLPDYTRANPGGIKVASELVRRLLEDQPRPIVLGGFSQGAMLSGEIAFQTDQDLAGLILLSGTTVNEDAWAERFAERRQLPIFIAHGRDDGVLSFAIMERFQQRLKAAGMNVTWIPFDGGHSVPADVVAALNEWITIRRWGN
jgi:phospholipase/carboxylesterase